MRNGLYFELTSTDEWSEVYYRNDEAYLIIYYNGDIEYYKEGNLHSLDGPAVKNQDGVKLWYFEGKCIPVKSQEEFTRYINLLEFK